MKIEFDDFEINYDVQYGKRKHMYMSVDEFGFVTIKAPNNTGAEIIEDVLKKYSDKLKNKIEERSKIRDEIGVKSYDHNGKFPYLGKSYNLNELIEIEDLTVTELKEMLKKFYISKSKEIINERVKLYQKQLNLKPKVIVIDEAKSRWGSCTSEKKLTFNYRLIMSPIEAIDYVVVHELCHLKHMNHDRSFWRLVGSIFPDYKERQAYLNKYGIFYTL